MKLTKYALLAACTVTLASCSSDEPANNAASDNQETATSTGFAQFDIKLPQASASRAIDSYQEGTADEYAVTNGKIIVFKEAGTEAEATFVCTAELLGMNWTSATTGEITTTSSTVAELSNINLTDASTYAAVIVLNYDNTFQFPSAGQTFGAWSKTPQNSGMILSKDGKSYLTMTNAAKYVSTSAEPAVLVQIDKSKIAQSESAISGSAATIHVQRATAKVTVITSSEAYTPTGAAYTSDKVTIDAWALDITNKTTYPVQVTEGLTTDYAGIWSEDRFFGGTQFARVFWAKDPNYSNNILDQETTEGNFNVINASAITSAPAKAYCLENTFDVNHMMQGQTTRVVLKGTYRPNGIPENENFYKIGSSTQLWSQDNLQKQVLAKAQDVLQNDTDVTVDLGTVATAKGFHALSEIDIKKPTFAFQTMSMPRSLPNSDCQTHPIRASQHISKVRCTTSPASSTSATQTAPGTSATPHTAGTTRSTSAATAWSATTGTSSTCCLYPTPVHPTYPTSSMTPPMTKTITTSRSKSTSLLGLSAYRT